MSLVSDRTDLSKRDVNRIADTLYSVWQQVVNQQSHQKSNPQPEQDRMGELIDYLQKLKPGETKTDELNAKLECLISEMGDSGGNGRSQRQANAAIAERLLVRFKVLCSRECQQSLA